MINKNYYIKHNLSLEDAIIKMNLNKIGFLAIVDEKFSLVGILTDSDLRTAFLEKKNTLIDIINKNPITTLENVPRSKIISQLKNSYMRHMPVVDKNNILKEVIVLAHEERYFKKNKVIIMAGGLGKRLGYLTRNKPKPMLNIAEKPILEHIIKNCISYGFSEFIISVNYKQDVIKKYFEDGSSLGVNIEYIEEKKKLGTGGALSLIDEINDDFLVLNGDILTTINLDNLLNFHLENRSFATICAKKSHFIIPFGVLEKNYKNDFISIKEKPSIEYLVNAGIYAFSPKSINLLKKNHYIDLPKFIQRLQLQNMNIKIFEFDNFWADIGNLENFKEVSEQYSNIPSFLYG